MTDHGVNPAHVEVADLRSALIDNLRLLSFEHWFEMSKDKLKGVSVHLNSSLFEHQDHMAMAHIMYFLFKQLNPTEYRTRFKGSFPPRDKKMEGDFRKAALEWLRDLSGEEGDFWITKPTPAHLVNPCGDKICKILLDLSNLVILKLCTQSNKATLKSHMDSMDTNELKSKAVAFDEAQAKLRDEVSCELRSWEEKFKPFLEEQKNLSGRNVSLDEKIKETAELMMLGLDEPIDDNLAGLREQLLDQQKTINMRYDALKKDWTKLSAMNKDYEKIFSEFDSVVHLMKDMDSSGPSLLKSIDILQAIKKLSHRLTILKKQLSQINYGEVHKLKDDVLFNIKSLERWETEQAALIGVLNQLIEQTKDRCEKMRIDLLRQPSIKQRRERLRQLFKNNPLPTVPKLVAKKPTPSLPMKPSHIIKEIREAIKKETAASVPTSKDKGFKTMLDDSFHFADISAIGFVAPSSMDMTSEGFSPPKGNLMQNITLRSARFEFSEMNSLLHDPKSNGNSALPPSTNSKKPPSTGSKSSLDMDVGNSFFDLIVKDQSQEGLLNEPPLLID